MGPDLLQFLEVPKAPATLHNYHSAQILPRWWLQLEPNFVTASSLLYYKPLNAILME